MPRKTSKHALVAVSGNATDQVIQAAWGPAVTPGTSTPTGRVRVLSLSVSGGSVPGTVQFNSKGGGAGTAIFGPFVPPTGTAVPLVIATADDTAACVTNAGEALTVTTAGVTGTTLINIDYDFQPGF